MHVGSRLMSLAAIVALGVGHVVSEAQAPDLPSAQKLARKLARMSG